MSVYEEAHTIFVAEFEKPTVVNGLLGKLYQADQSGDTVLNLDFGGSILTDPNVCTPLAGILDYYRSEKKLGVVCNNVPAFMAKVRLLVSVHAYSVES